MEAMTVNPSAILLENIFLAFEDKTFSKTLSAYLVGGRKKLEKLIVEGKVEMESNGRGKGSTWNCNAAQVLRHCKNFRKQSSKTHKI